jgi:ABC-type transporter Mla subunit MlaD
MKRPAPPRGPRRRIRGTLLRHVAVLDRRTLLLGFAVAAIGAVMIVFAWLSTNGLPFQGKYPFSVVLPGTTPPLASGAQVRVAGKIAGSVTSVEPGPNTLKVNAFLSSSYGPLGRGASIHVGVLLGTTLVYLVVNPGDYRHPLPAGTVIPESRVTLSSSLPQALETFDAATRAALARNITVTGEGWLGRGAQTNAAIADQASDYQYGTPELRALVPMKGILAETVAASASVAHGLLGARPDDNAAGTAAAATFWQTTAQNNRAATATQRFSGAEQQLLETLPPADQTIAAATSAAQAFEPLAEQIKIEDPAFESLFSSAPTLVSATRRFNRYAPDVLKALIPIFAAIRRPAEALPLIIQYGNTLDQGVNRYSTELAVLARQLAAVTHYTFAGSTALRITGMLGCPTGRDPYPAPGQAAKDRGGC